MITASESLQDHYCQLREKLACLRQDSPLAAAKVALIAVSKFQPPQRVDALLAAGHRHFGENRWQEGWERWQERKSLYPDLALHFLGPLQTNKAAEVVGFFDVIHSLDRPKLARVLAEEMQKQQRRRPCFIQINTGEEPQKSGILPADAPDFIRYCRDELNLPLVGLMGLPPAGVNPAPHFAFLRKLAQDHGLERLSMGMSGDWEIAVRLGATDIRLGTALFGERLA